MAPIFMAITAAGFVIDTLIKLKVFKKRGRVGTRVESAKARRMSPDKGA
jgi:hypothetical protein